MKRSNIDAMICRQEKITDITRETINKIQLDKLNAVLKREKDYPTGLDVDGIGVAIPHTDAEHVKKEGISIAVLDHPVKFDAMGEDDCRIPIKIVIMFTVAGKDKHIDRLLQILDMIKDEEILQGLLDAKNKEEIRTVIQKREKSDIN